ncbi:hypothetical protein ES703_35633 [subsurface metagenome]
MSKLNLIKILNRHIDSKIVSELVEEYKKAKTSFWLDDKLKTLIYSARFSELSIQALEYISNPNCSCDLNKIEFGKIYSKLIQLPKNKPEDEILYLAMPQTLKSIFTIRSKKKAAHFKQNELDKIDADLAITSCNWVMAQFILIFHKNSPDEAIEIANSLITKKIPTIEEFEEGEFMILKKNMKLGDELLLWLYHFNRRMNSRELIKIVKPKEPSYIPMYLKRLFDDKLIHKNKDGAIINKNGIIKIESNKEKYFN